MKYWMSLLWENVQSREEREWSDEIESKPKLRSYKMIKPNLNLEPYLLTELNKSGRFVMTNLRTGTNNLKIETGRWIKQKEEDRKCMTCMSGEVEDERHFMIDCEMYSDLRDKMYQDIKFFTKGKWNMDQLDKR
jgi:hypothetical protein